MSSDIVLKPEDNHVFAFPFTILSDFGNGILNDGAYASPCSFTLVLFGWGLLDFEVVCDLTTPGYKAFHGGLGVRLGSSCLRGSYPKSSCLGSSHLGSSHIGMEKNYAAVCETEGFSSGDCRGLRRRCLCTRPC
uniref:Uncharacterized protein LOC104213512 n=1 Tax=Nicotiana sylvestris TaxID=4096 RepID=A0A1U7VG71_NICSY|nr:PREDICTED: uncharacterized protein LOC104213512 [Nicotiana sylvestris]